MNIRNDLLETCLARLAAGDSVANCLADYPAEAELLRPFLTAASQLQTLPPGQLSPTADKTIQSQLRQAAANQANTSHPRQRQFHFMEDSMKNVSRFFSRWLPRVVVAGTAVALVIIFITQFTNLAPTLSNPDTEPAAETHPTSVTTVGNATITLEADLSADPGEVSLYRAQIEPIPATPEEALAWAQNFGLPDPVVYRPFNTFPASGTNLLVLGSNGQQLAFQSYDGFSDISYSNPAASLNNSGLLPFEEASTIAVAFLRDHNVLPDAYQIEPALGNSGLVQQLIIRPQVENGLISGDLPGTVLRVEVNGDGQVVHATLSQLTLEPAGTTAVISAQQAYDDLLNGRNIASSSYSTMGTGDEYRSFAPPAPTWEVGQAVNLVGYLNVLVNVQTEDLRVTLNTPDREIYLLSGSDLDALSAQAQRGGVRVQGTITGQEASGNWQMAVNSWEGVSPADFDQPCLIGTLTRTGESAQFLSEDGADYNLPNAPEEIAEGEQLQICLSAPAEPGSALAWYSIRIPPLGAGLPSSSMTTTQVSGSGGGGSGGIVTEQVVVEQAVEVTRVVTENVDLSGSSGLSLEPGPPTGPTAVFTEPTSPYEIGDEVTLTGVVQMFRIVGEDGQERLEASFANEGDQGEASYPFTYPLLATPELLEEMAEFNSLHIRVNGRVVASPDTEMFFVPNGEQAIEVDSFDRPWPEEKMERFLGHLSLEEVEGQQVLIFTDHATNQLYVINPPDLPPEAYAHDSTLDEDQILLTGIVYPVNTFGGLPLLERRGTSAGSEIAQATDISQIPMEEYDSIPMINESDIHRRDGLGGIVSGDVVIERVELVYPYQPQPTAPGSEIGTEPQMLEPVWAFYGRSANGREQFIIHVRATTGN